jgi:hypothetical protein
MTADPGVAELPPLGSLTFFRTLLSNIHAASPSLPLDSVVLQTILICMIAGDKHLILRTEEEDVGLVTKLATSVSRLLAGYNPGFGPADIPDPGLTLGRKSPTFLFLFMPS